MGRVVRGVVMSVCFSRRRSWGSLSYAYLVAAPPVETDRRLAYGREPLKLFWQLSTFLSASDAQLLRRDPALYRGSPSPQRRQSPHMCIGSRILPTFVYQSKTHNPKLEKAQKHKQKVFKFTGNVPKQLLGRKKKSTVAVFLQSMIYLPLSQ